MVKVDIVPGRFNPPHLGHRFLMNKAIIHANPHQAYVVIIQGRQTELNKDRNPLTFEQKKRIINTFEPQIIVRRFPQEGSNKIARADIPEIIIEILEEMSVNETDFLFTIHCGSDEAAMYKVQADNPLYVKKIKDDLKRQDYNIKIEVDSSARTDTDGEVAGYSATKVRNAVRTGNDDAAMRMLGIADESFYEEIKAAILAGVKKEAIEQKINSILEKI